MAVMKHTLHHHCGAVKCTVLYLNASEMTLKCNRNIVVREGESLTDAYPIVWMISLPLWSPSLSC